MDRFDAFAEASLPFLDFITNLGGSIAVHDCARDRNGRSRARATLRDGARAGLLKSYDGGKTYTLTDKAIEALETSKQAA